MTKAQYAISAYLHCVIEGIVPSATLPEYARFLLGFKPGFRVFTGANAVMRVQSAMGAAGFPIEASALSARDCGGSWASISKETATGVTEERSIKGGLLVAAHSAKQARDILEAELNGSGEAGYLLGYPDCCVAAYGAFANAGPAWAAELFQRTPLGSGSARANRLPIDWGGLSPVGELFPCSLACGKAAEIGSQGFDALTQLGLAGIAQRVQQDATSPFLIERSRARCGKAGENDTYTLRW